ncbi:MAG: Hsp20/alpha crystallin family protein [Methanomassiliicoccaceae archaeon]|nr:Hsp20/alpha crystallin family protein [Methanomassiliicoccaceae archaeon]
MDTDEFWNSFFLNDRRSMADRIEEMFSAMERMQGDGVTYGYTMYRGPNGEQHVKEFGNMPGRKQSDPVSEPLIDVTVEGGTVRAVVEIPGVSKEDIILEGTARDLSVKVETEGKSFSKTLALPCDVDPDSAKAEYNNGILEVVLTAVE